MTQDSANSSQNNSGGRSHKAGIATHYTLLGLHPSASVREIRQAYRDLSKLYHPDTTELPAAIATEKFRQLNEAYGTLSNPERRQAYDQKIGYSRVVVSQPLPSLNQPQPKSSYSSSAYIDSTDRPLSAGELFALFILGITFIGCLILAIAIGLTRGEKAFQPLTRQEPVPQENQTIEADSAKESLEGNAASQESETKQPAKFPFFPVKAPELKSPPASAEESKQPSEPVRKTEDRSENVSASINPTEIQPKQKSPNQETIKEAKPSVERSQPNAVQASPDVKAEPSPSAASVSIDSSNSAL